MINRPDKQDSNHHITFFVCFEFRWLGSADFYCVLPVQGRLQNLSEQRYLYVH